MVVGLIGVQLGLAWADAAVAIGIGVVICLVAVRVSGPVLARLADRVDPAIVERIARVAAAVPEVGDVHDIRARYAGRGLYVALHVGLPGSLTLVDAHALGERVRRSIVAALPNVVQVDLHLDPLPHGFGHHDLPWDG